ncbi:hypothetical protein [Ralstonia pseudosolanacearum]|uniref:hypothetical protein n=1 Tax=Ralstonia pseudosolanacearum TaxID=1310165 RepID=UPI001FFAB500|nr:hypothetical protein [Ralstonia pseudosolanacearum]
MTNGYRKGSAIGPVNNIQSRKWITIASFLGPAAFCVGAIYGLPFMYRWLGLEFCPGLFYLVVGVGPLFLHILIAQWFGSRRRILALALLLVGTQFALSLLPVQIANGPTAETVGGLESLRPAALLSELIVGVAWLALAGVFLLVERAVRLAYEALLKSK